MFACLFLACFFHQLDRQDTKLVWGEKKKKERKKESVFSWVECGERFWHCRSHCWWGPCVGEQRSALGNIATPKGGRPRGRWGQCCQSILLFPLLSCPGSWLRTSKTWLNTVIWPCHLPWLWKGPSHRESCRAEPMASIPPLIPGKSRSIVFALAMYAPPPTLFCPEKNLFIYSPNWKIIHFIHISSVIGVNCWKLIKQKNTNPKNDSFST